MEDDYGFEVPQMQWYDESKNPYVRGYEAPANMVEQASAPLPDNHELYPDYDFSELKTTNNRPVNSDYLNYIYKKLRKSGFDDKHASVLLGQIAEESGGDPFAVDATGTYNGLLQWSPDRYQINTFYDDDPYKEINRQLKYLLSTIDNLDDGKSWTHGGEGSGYRSRKDAYADWRQDEDMERMNRGLSLGHVRAAGMTSSADNIYKVGSQIYDTVTAPNMFAEGGPTVREIWEERTGKPWAEVGNYYTDYNGSAKNNLVLLDKLTSGKYDYLLHGSTPPTEEVLVDKQEAREPFLTTVKNKAIDAASALVDLPDTLLGRNDRYKDWKEQEAGDYVFNTDTTSVFDFSQQAAPDEMKKIWSKYVNGEPLTEWESTQCATFITDWRRKMGGNSAEEGNAFVAQNNFRGNAWTWLKNAEKEVEKGNTGVSVPYNMYSEDFTGDETKDSVIRRSRAIARTPEYQQAMQENLRPGSVVTLLYPGSNHFGAAAAAFKDGTGNTMSTHMGDIIEQDGVLYVRDNVGGHIHIRPLDRVLANKERDGVLITGIANYEGNGGDDYYDLSRFGLVPNEEVLNRPTTVANAAAYRELDAIDKNKDMLKEKYGIDDEEYDELRKTALGVSIEESFMGRSENWKADVGKTTASRYLRSAAKDDERGAWDQSRNREFGLKSVLGLLKPYAEAGSEVIGDIRSFFGNDESAIPMAESKGLSNIKYRGDRGDGKALFTMKELKDLGITPELLKDKRFMESPEVSGVMTMVALKKKKTELQEILKDMPKEIQEDSELLSALLRQSWNQGTGKIRKIVSNIASGKSSVDSLLQFKDPELRPRKENGELDTDWYTDRIARNIGYYVDTDAKARDLIDVGDLSKLSSDKIKEVQRFLVLRGFLDAVIDGKNQIDGAIGKNTRRALAKYKASKAPTASIDPVKKTPAVINLPEMELASSVQEYKAPEWSWDAPDWSRSPQ